MSEAEQIAAKLTEAQRRAVASATWSEGRGVWHPPGWYCHADRRVRCNLSRAGLAGGYLRRAIRLTPLGLAVRKILQGDQ